MTAYKVLQPFATMAPIGVAHPLRVVSLVADVETVGLLVAAGLVEPSDEIALQTVTPLDRLVASLRAG